MCIKDMTILSALKVMDKWGFRILVLIDNDEKLVGTITDGDVRRWILKNGDFNNSVYSIVNKSPIFLYEKYKNKAQKILKEKSISAIPIINNRQEVKDIIFLQQSINEDLKKENIDAAVIINAGGLGSRLAPLTNIIPKPLIPIGDNTIIGRIMDKFNKFGVSDFNIIINYKKEMIKSYFKESDTPYNLSFVEEATPLGTIGGVGKLKDKFESPIFISNCDVLVDGDYSDMLDFHKNSLNKITIISFVKQNLLQYGVIELNKDGEVIEIKEKPEINFLANSGFYIFDPDVLDDIPNETYYHATDLINDYIKRDKKVGIYPISEDKWLDMGEFSELDNMLVKLNLK